MSKQSELVDLTQGAEGNISAVNATLTGYLRGPATFTINPAVHSNNTGLVVIAGNLQVDGTTTTINSTTMDVDDLNITVASGAANAAAANGAGLTVDGASATLLYASTGDKFVFNKPLDVTGNIGVTGTVDGIDIAARDAILTSTTTTAGAALPKAGGTMTGALVGTSATFSPSSGKTFVIASDSGDGPYIGASNNQSLRIITNNATRITIAAAGDVTVPGKILVNTDIRLGSEGVRLSSDGNGEFGIGYGQTATNSRFTVYNNTAVAFRVLPNGNVGIGTSSPTVKLDVVGPASVTSFTGATALGMVTRGSTGATDYSGIDFRGNNQTSAVARIAVLTTGGGSRLQFGTSNSYASGITNTALTINEIGNVGIGTSTPEMPWSNHKGLHIKTAEGASDVRLEKTVSGTTTSDWVIRADDAGDFIFRNNMTTKQPVVIDGVTGNVGINNTSPEAALTVNGVSALYDANAQYGLTITESGGPGKMAAGEINMIQGWSGTLTNGDTLVFTYNKVSWAAYGFEIEGSNAGQWGKIEGGGYSNGGPGLQSHTNVGGLFSSFAITSTSGNNQGLVMTMTLSGGTHTAFRIRYFQSGGDGLPIPSRATLDLNS